MNEERAKKVLQEQIDKYGQEYDEEGIEALGMAIKALEQQPCDDCVSRETALNGLYATDLKGWQLAVAFEAIEKLPSVTPKPKTGHWISLGGIPSSLGAYRWCSNCDCGIDVMEFHRNHYNFCPNCGVKMEGEDEND